MPKRVVSCRSTQPPRRAIWRLGALYGNPAGSCSEASVAAGSQAPGQCPALTADPPRKTVVALAFGRWRPASNGVSTCGWAIKRCAT